MATEEVPETSPSFVEDLRTTWAMWLKSKAWYKRPSELIGLEDPYMAYCYDEAVYAWGSFIESELDSAVAEAHKNKRKRKKVDESLIRQRKLAELLQLPMEKRFRSFRAAAGRPPLPKEGQGAELQSG